MKVKFYTTRTCKLYAENQLLLLPKVNFYTTSTCEGIKKIFEIDKYPNRCNGIANEILEKLYWTRNDIIYAYLGNKMELGLLLQEKRRIENAKKEKEQSK